jgi:hypothetical protein
VIKNLIRGLYNDIFTKLYEITDGRVILSGSLGLKLQNIIQREANDLDVTLLSSDWELYNKIIKDSFKVYPSVQIRSGELQYDVYTCFDKITKLNEFHLFVNHGKDVYITLNGIRVFNPKLQLMDKEIIMKNTQDVDKHTQDITLIKNYLNEE